MWTCERCGRQFVTAHSWHSCVVIDEETHLEKSGEAVLATYGAIRDLVTALGARVEPVKGYIELRAETQFASVTPRQKWLLLHIGAEHPLEHPLRDHTEGPYNGVIISRFKLSRPEDLDATLRGYLKDAHRDFGLRKRL